ncbi:hypothetical protein [Nocardia sp. NPDC005366]|uniref:hypothetical protein n=1 Tax=Nocardia sp. NPDC005366 TaxID=3156878 RepID=UPI00339F0FE9
MSSRRSIAVLPAAATMTTSSGARRSSYPGDAPHIFEAIEAGTWAKLVIEYA